MWTDEVKETAPSHIKCGCTWEMWGYDESYLKSIHLDHDCPNAPVDPPEHWLSHIFSFPMAFVILALGLAISWILDPSSGPWS